MSNVANRSRPGVVATKVRVPDVPSMRLDRLDARIDRAWEHRLVVVVAPAGSGKTSLLSRFAGRAAGPVGWYRAEGWDSAEADLVRHLEAALAPVLPGIERDWEHIEDVANALAGWNGPRMLLVVDDLHTLEGTAAEAALERLIEYAPAALTVAIGSRRPPRFNLPRLRVSGHLLELSGEDLRFRSWEVERLFRDFYEEPLPPEELARLARRTEGWAAGLQLFHLATRGRTAEERRRVLGELGDSSRLARELRDYLAGNVLDQLPPDLRRFLVETSVLGRLSASLCDRLLGRSDSRAVLEDLERGRLFTHKLPEDGWYRYHEVLRSHLHAVLLQEVGPDGLRDRFCTAGALLVEFGATPEAVEAFCRGEDWERVSRLLGGSGREVASAPSGWLDALPPAIVANDPWLLLANARRLRSQGRFAEAAEGYRLAEVAFGGSDAGATCRSERLAIAAWLEGASPLADRREPSALLRQAVSRDPMAILPLVEFQHTAEGETVAGLVALAAGHVGRARRDLLHAVDRTDADRMTQIVAALGAGAAGLLMGQRHATIEVDGAVATAEEFGIEWLARIGRAIHALNGSDEAVREAASVADACRRLGDDWGEAIARLLEAWGTVAVAGRDHPGTAELARALRALGAGTLEAWALGLDALHAARTGEPEARAVASAAESSARAAGVPAASLVAALALAASSASTEEVEEFSGVAAAIARETGLLVPDVARNDETSEPEARVARGPSAGAAPIRIQLLGGFVMVRDGVPVDLSGVRPRARALLRLLCLHAGAAVHHETIEAAMWPEAPPEAASRNLHVAVAALRRVMEPTAARRSFELIRRDGDAYRLSLPAGAQVDLGEFEAAAAAGRAAAAAGNDGEAARWLEEAVARYTGDLLPEDGPAEWVADRREMARLVAVDAAQRLALILLRSGDAEAAARAANAGLRIDRLHDPLWRLLIEAREAAGDAGAANRARNGYGRMLAELGVGVAAESPA